LHLKYLLYNFQTLLIFQIMLNKLPNLIDIRPLYYQDIYDLKFLAPEFFFFCSLLLMLIFGSLNFGNTKKLNNIILNAQILIVLLVLTLLLFLNNFEDNLNSIVFHDLLAIENFSTSLKIVVILLTISIIISAKQFITQNEIKEYDYIIILGLITAGIFFLLSSTDFMALLLSTELISFGLYTIITLKKKSIYAAESAVKYFVFGSFVSGLYLYGTSLVYIQTGTTNFFSLQYYFYNEKNNNLGISPNYLETKYFFLLFGLILIITLLLFKVSAFPFHTWSPDVYEGAPMIITAYFAIVIKFVMLLTFIRVIYFALYDLLVIFQPGLVMISVLSMLFGSIGACYQDKIKRLFAYSSISHVGYIILALATKSPDGITTALLYTFIYTITNVALFNFLLSADYKEKETNQIIKITYLSDLRGTGKANPTLGVMLAFALFSFAGVPPFAGFFVKFQLFITVLTQNFFFPALIIIISSAISTFYYLKIIKCLFFFPPSTNNVITNLNRTKEITIFWVILVLSLYIFFSSEMYTQFTHIWHYFFYLFIK
jgi:NADH-quinone oxidoreductase subunit N